MDPVELAVDLSQETYRTVLYVIMSIVIASLSGCVVVLWRKNNSLQDSRREDALANLDVLKDLSAILRQAVGGQSEIRGEMEKCYDKLTADLKHGFQRLEDVFKD